VTAAAKNIQLYRAEFDKLYIDASYSAQTYYEGSKAAELWGRGIVFAPALVAAISSLLVILGLSKLWGVVGIVSAVVSATSSFLGAERKASLFRESGNSFTKIRHEARMWRDSLVEVRPETEAFETLKRLRDDYSLVVDRIELPANRFFKRASERIETGVLEYDPPAQSKPSP
jgi:hypothetical protein